MRVWASEGARQRAHRSMHIKTFAFCILVLFSYMGLYSLFGAIFQ